MLAGLDAFTEGDHPRENDGKFRAAAHEGAAKAHEEAHAHIGKGTYPEKAEKARQLSQEAHASTARSTASASSEHSSSEMASSRAGRTISEPSAHEGAARSHRLAAANAREDKSPAGESLAELRQRVGMKTFLKMKPSEMTPRQKQELEKTQAHKIR